MPQGIQIANMTVNKRGKLTYKGLRVPPGVSLANTHIQLNGFTESGEVRSITVNASLFKRTKVQSSESGELDAVAKRSIRAIIDATKGESMVRCVVFADPANEEQVAEKTEKAAKFCSFAQKQNPNITTKVSVREIKKKRQAASSTIISILSFG
jgi:hypothetical protein